jgi:hypothetical protein
MRQTHTAAPLEAVVATRAMVLDGRPYARGERVDTTTLSKAKVAQLLDLRRLEPAAAGQ